MKDNEEKLWEKYELDINRVYKGRGFLALQANDGIYRLLEYKGTEKRLLLLNELYEKLGINLNERLSVDCLIRDKEGNLSVEGEDGSKYIVTRWTTGRDLNLRDLNDIYEGARYLGLLHRASQGLGVDLGTGESLIAKYDKHEKEMRRIKTYIRGRKNKTSFEYKALGVIDEFIEKASKTREDLENSDYLYLEEKMSYVGDVCHGSYNYHNIFLENDGAFVANLDKAYSGMQIRDLHLYLRKVMEKYGWRKEVGLNVIKAYEKERKLSDDELWILSNMLSYPEKFWKILNQYMNNNKAWIPSKYLEKLKDEIDGAKCKEEFAGIIIK